MGSVSRRKRRPQIRYALEHDPNGYIRCYQPYSELRSTHSDVPLATGVYANAFVIEWYRNYHREIKIKLG